MRRFIVSATALLTGFGLGACHRNSETDNDANDPRVEHQSVIFPEKSPARSSVITSPVEAAARRRTKLNGRLVWNEDLTVRVYAPFAGRVEQVKAQLADRVSPGAALAIIASADYAQVRADAKKAAADFALADRTRDRLRILAEHGAVARKDVQSAEADYERAASELERAKAAIEMRGGNIDAQSSQFVLRSPVEGVVVEKNVGVGQEVRPDQLLANAPQLFAPLFTISEPTDLWLYVDASDRDLPSLGIKVPLIVRSPAFPERTFRAVVESISDGLDPATRMVRVRGRVENPDRLLKAEMFVSVELETSPAQGVDAPARAVLMNNDKHFVYVEDGPGKYTRREVAIGGEQDEKLWVLNGLSPGDRVVIDGGLFLERIREAATND